VVFPSFAPLLVTAHANDLARDDLTLRSLPERVVAQMLTLGGRSQSRLRSGVSEHAAIAGGEKEVQKCGESLRSRFVRPLLRL
jgi:hypothetical protein